MFKKILGRFFDFVIAAAVICGSGLGLAGCGDGAGDSAAAPWSGGQSVADSLDGSEREYSVNAVNFDRRLDDYEPQKREYNFYFTYKTVHPWWDAVALGIEDAAKQYEEKGIIINYEYPAPNGASAQDQIRRISDAALRDFDVIGVDVADVEIVTPAINQVMAKGEKVMTFS